MSRIAILTVLVGTLISNTALHAQATGKSQMVVGNSTPAQTSGQITSPIGVGVAPPYIPPAVARQDKSVQDDSKRLPRCEQDRLLTDTTPCAN